MAGGAILAGIVTPFDESGALDEALLRQQLRFIGDGGSGVYLCGHGSGEGDLLSVEEKVQVYRAGVDELGGHVPVSAFVANTGTTAEVVEMAKRAEDTGVDAVQIVAPRPGPRRPLDEELEAYFRQVIEAVSCEVHLNDNVSLAGYSLPDALLDTLINDYAHVRGVNLSLGLQEVMARTDRLVKRHGERIAVRSGIAPAITAVQALGGAGLLCFEPNVAPRLTVSVWNDLASPGEGFGERYATLLRLNMILSRYGNPRSLKAALRILGRDAGVPRRPYLPLPDRACTEMAEQLAGLHLQDFESY